jgi:hypothetical protein
MYLAEARRIRSLGIRANSKLPPTMMTGLLIPTLDGYCVNAADCQQTVLDHSSLVEYLAIGDQ